MENLKKTTVKYPYLERPVEIYERECGHKIVFAYKSGSLINISSWVKTGSINENDENNGISHFLEHLMFKGTTKHKAGYFDRTLEAKGAIVNAATWKDYTFYYVTVPKDDEGKNFALTLELHSDMMLNPVVPDNEIGAVFDINKPEEVTEKRERHVVIEEIRMRKDQPWSKTYNNLNAAMYTSHPYGRDVTGTEQIISSITREDVLNYYGTHYTPSNITTVIVGDLEAEEAVNAAVEAFDFKGRENRAQEAYAIDMPQNGMKTVEDYSKINTGFLMFGRLCTPARDIKTSLILEMLCLILGQGESSRLNLELIEKPEDSLFNMISTDYYSFRDGGNFFIQANFKPECKDEAIKLIKEQVEELRKNGITGKELFKAKKKIKSAFAEEAETVSDIAETIGYYMTVLNDLNYVEEYAEQTEKITVDDVNKVARDYLNIENFVVSILMPEEYGIGG